jgi:K(+)-stimulated pyrophosphate-energized sodium pump
LGACPCLHEIQGKDVFMTVVLIAIGCGIVAVLYGILTSSQVLRASAGNERMVAVSAAIQEGRQGLSAPPVQHDRNRRNRRRGPGLDFLDRMGTPISAGGFVLGSLLSGSAGFIGMNISVRANVRTAEAGPDQPAAGPHHRVPRRCDHRHARRRPRLARHLGLLLRARSASRVTRPTTASSSRRSSPSPFGASLISIFARLGGGIFTKAADVGADLVGKVEAGIPEDDPRNPAVIADNVGDNVGDCAGMAADLFESYSLPVGATMVASIALLSDRRRPDAAAESLPLITRGVCILTSIIAPLLVPLSAQAVDHKAGPL